MIAAEEVDSFERVRARFQPRDLDTLKPTAAALIGQVFDWQAMWIITPEDGGPYVGEVAFMPMDLDRIPGRNWAWVPGGDLVRVD